MPPYLKPVNFFKYWPYAPIRAVGQLELSVLGRPKKDFGRLCSTLSALWAEECNSCAVQLLPEIGGTVMSWSETLPSAAPGKVLRLGPSRELTGAGVEHQAPVRPDLIEDGPVGHHGIFSEVVRAGVENGLDGLGEASSGGGVVACVLESAPL